jgi:hypothetical protein
MSDVADTPSREEQMLARLAELDLAAAEKAHGKFMAAEESSEIAELGRTYQRLSRSLRQTLALKARLARQREAIVAKTPRPETSGPPSRFAHLTPKVRAHIDSAAAAVMAFIERETEADDFAHIGETEVYEVLMDLARDEDFLHTPAQHLLDQVMDILDPLPDEADELDAPADPPAPEPALQDSA